MKLTRTALGGLAFVVALAGCDGPRCGPGTVEVDGVCVVADAGTTRGADGGARDGGAVDVDRSGEEDDAGPGGIDAGGGGIDAGAGPSEPVEGSPCSVNVGRPDDGTREIIESCFGTRHYACLFGEIRLERDCAFLGERCVPANTPGARLLNTHCRGGIYEEVCVGREQSCYDEQTLLSCVADRWRPARCDPGRRCVEPPEDTAHCGERSAGE